MGENSEVNLQAVRKKNNRVMLLFVLSFLVPVMLAYVVFTFFPDMVRKMGSTNFGSFVQPVRLLSAEGLRNGVHGPEVDARFFFKKWTYVYMDSSGCDAICLKNLDNQRRVELAQGKEALRVRRIFIITDTDAVDSLKVKLSAYKNLKVYTVDDSVRKKFLAQFKVTEGPVSSAKRVYLIDPKGRLIMYYLPDTRKDKPNIEILKGMGDDLKLLLKNSMIG